MASDCKWKDIRIRNREEIGRNSKEWDYWDWNLSGSIHIKIINWIIVIMEKENLSIREKDNLCTSCKICYKIFYKYSYREALIKAIIKKSYNKYL